MPPAPQKTPLPGERPYLILTLRRTGGTSLMALMNAVSGYPGLQHEPLNRDRVWGEVHTRFAATGDSEAMREALGERLARRPNIKHCYEIVPVEISEALIELCAAQGYQIFTLLRRDEIARLRSLMLAITTGAWGDKQAKAIYPGILAGETKLEPVDLSGLEYRARTDAARTEALLEHMRATGIAFDEIVFEDLYARDGQVRARVAAIIAKLGRTLDPTDERLAAFTQSKGQGSQRILEFIPNRDALERALDSLRAAR